MNIIVGGAIKGILKGIEERGNRWWPSKLINANISGT